MTEGRSADQFSQLSLVEPGPRPESSDFARDMIVSPGSLQGGQSLGFTMAITALENLHCVGGRFSFFLGIIRQSVFSSFQGHKL
jgi:hypothetical protein